MSKRLSSTVILVLRFKQMQHIKHIFMVVLNLWGLQLPEHNAGHPLPPAHIYTQNILSIYFLGSSVSNWIQMYICVCSLGKSVTTRLANKPLMIKNITHSIREVFTLSDCHAYMLSRFSCVRLCVTPWTAACQASLSMGFFMQEYWSGLPFFSPGDIPHPGIKLMSLKSTCIGRWVLYH